MVRDGQCACSFQAVPGSSAMSTVHGSPMTGPQTLIDKIWKRHVIRELSDGRTLLHIDRHLIHDGSSRQAFDGLRATFRTVRNPTLNFAVVDHIVSTLPGRTGESHPPGQERMPALLVDCDE